MESTPPNLHLASPHFVPFFLLLSLLSSKYLSVPPDSLAEYVLYIPAQFSTVGFVSEQCPRTFCSLLQVSINFFPSFLKFSLWMVLTFPLIFWVCPLKLSIQTLFFHHSFLMEQSGLSFLCCWFWNQYLIIILSHSLSSDLKARCYTSASYQHPTISHPSLSLFQGLNYY